MNEIRTRFAPSPTGALHAGTVRTALFAWLVARHSGGKFFLRIEDTDQARLVEGSLENITETLKFMGLDWDAGPEKETELGPFFQSKRLDKYKEFGEKLINSGKAYADPYSQDELQAFRDEAKVNKKPFLYRDHRPENPPFWNGSQPLRLKSDPKEYKWNDIVMGDLSTGPEVIDDLILIKSDGFPTYNFAHIIDDHLMGITHVIRSQEFISSMPNFLNIYDALGFEWPQFATIPPVLDISGKAKLSKRKGAKQILEYRDMGIMPETILNFLALLGWNDGTTQEIFSREELIAKFDLSRVQKGGAQFNEDQLIHLNGVYIRALSIDDLNKKVTEFWPVSANQFDDEYKKKVLNLVQDRLKYFEELPKLTELFFEDLPVDINLINNNKFLGIIAKNELTVLLQTSKKALKNSDFSVHNLTQILNDLLNETNQKPVVLFSLIRIATTQAPSSPGLAETISVIGRDRTFSRIDKMLDALNAD